MAGCNAGNNNENRITIGLIASLTGPAADQGHNWSDGALLAGEEWKRRRIVDPELPELTIVLEDDGTTPSRAASSFQKLITVDRVNAIVGGTWDYLGETIYPLAERYHIPVITPTSPVEALTESTQKNPWIFSNGLTLEAEGRAIAEYFKNQKIRSIALLYPNLPFGTTHRDLILRKAGESGVSVVFDQSFAYDAGYPDNLRTPLLTMKDLSPDCVFAVLDGGGIEVVVAELQRIKFDTALITTQHLDQAFKITRDPARYTKAFGIYPALDPAEFIARFEAHYGAKPRVFASNGYDAVLFFAEALAAKIPFGTPEAIFTYKGITGTHSLTPTSRGLVKPTATIMTTQGGVFEELR